MKTISGREINAKPNHSKRHFTIYTDTAVWRTLPMTKTEFNSCLFNTANDWQQFLKSDEYFKVRDRFRK